MIELLVVIAIIAVLVSLLLPALKRARQSASDAVCLSQLKQIAIGYMLYADEHGDVAPYTHGYPTYPPYLANPAPYSYLGLAIVDALYVQDAKVFLCPDTFTGRGKYRPQNAGDDINSSRPYLVGPSSYGMDARGDVDGERRATWSRVRWGDEKMPDGQTHRWQEFPPTRVAAIKRPSANLTVADAGYVTDTGYWLAVNFLNPGGNAASWPTWKMGPVFGRHGNGVTALGPKLNFPQRYVQMAFVDGRAAAARFWEVQQNRDTIGPPEGHKGGAHDFQYFRNRNG